MFWKRKREGSTSDGFHWENMDEIYYLKRISEKQDEILRVLKDIDYKILDYFGNERDKKINEIHEVIREGNFRKSQMDAVSKLIKLSREMPYDIEVDKE